MPTHKQISDYMKQLSVLNDNINSFFRFNISDIQGGIRAKINFPAMALESPEGNFVGSNTNNSLDSKLFAFTIFDKPSRGNFDQEDDMLDDCELIGKQILARMRYDSLVPASVIYRLFKLEKVQYHKVGPVFTDHLFGYRFEVELSDAKVNMQINPADWSDLDDPCP